MERMNSHTQMEGILARRLGHILVSTNTRSFQSLAGKLFILVRHKVGTERELVDVGTLTPEVENTDLDR